MTKKSQVSSTIDIFTMPLPDLAKRAGQVAALLAQAEALLPGLLRYTKETRKRSNGKLRNGETAALLAVLAAADKYPQYFSSLAAKDHGTDDTVFESAPAREALGRIEALAPAAEALERLAGRLGDSALRLGEKGRGVALAAYEIAKANAKNDEALAGEIAPAADYYQGVVRPKNAKAVPTPAQPAASTVR
jgi:hypothetical protein